MFDRMLIATFAAAVFCGCVMTVSGLAGENAPPTREKADALMRDGNFREAADMYERLLFGEPVDAKDAAMLLEKAWTCLLRIGAEANEAAELRDRALAAWPDSWRMASLAARLIPDGRRPGFIQPLWRPGQAVVAVLPVYRDDRERSRMLVVMLRGERHLDDPADPATAGEKMGFYRQLGDLVLQNRDNRLAWRLTALTDLDGVGDASGRGEEMPAWVYPQRGAPVDANGEPVFFHAPASWEAAANDGERWRWTLERMAAQGEEGRAAADLLLGGFLMRQFGVHTIAAVAPLPRSADVAGETGPFAVRTLAENETASRLASGLRRFVMPEEFDFIAILRRVADADDFPEIRREALVELATEFENRQQYDKALGLWRAASAVRAGDDAEGGSGAPDRISRVDAAIERITGRNGLLEPGPVAPAGRTTTLTYLYRNGERVDFTARRLDERRLLGDIRTLVHAGAEDFLREYMYLNPATLGRWVVESGLDKYVTETAAAWSLELETPAGHRSRRVSVELPFSEAGCYLIEAAMDGGNTSRAVLWVADLALAKKDLDGGWLLYVADAVNGEPVAGATVSFLGYSMRHEDRRARVETVRDFAVKTDADGLIVIPGRELAGKAWLTTAETADGRLAYLGFEHFWSLDPVVETREPIAAFFLTDRPVYRPGQEVDFKLWLGRGSHVQAPGELSGKVVAVRVVSPMGDTVFEQDYSADAFGGASGVCRLDANAPLGQYLVFVTDGRGTHLGGGWFRLEEYRKPEFEVAVETPAEALRLGDKARVTVRAAYYYGAPVADARVVYKVVRTTHRTSWTPPWRWDWLYGAGAAYPEYAARPGFLPPREYEQPEIIADGEGRLDADGVFRITLDTAPAKALFGDRDHRYEVTAEVTDRSRRTIVGSGRVIASREAFTVRLWTDRGFYRAGREVRANVMALLPAGGGVEARGVATLFRRSFDASGAASEREVAVHDVATDADGNAEIRFVVDEAGQYRLSCRLSDAGGEAAVGDVALTVRGEAGDADFRFAALEMVVEKREYRPGETVRLRIGSENKSGAVLFFPRAERRDNAARPPRLLRLENGVAEVELEVGRADQPNFFCEAITVYEGNFYTEIREVFVPPADKILNVRVTSDKDKYLPGERAEFKVRVADADGRPVAGQCAVSVYDRSVEYISGGSNVGDIRAVFWGEKRRYSPVWQSSLDREAFSVMKRDDRHWEPIGVFGAQEADWNDTAVYTNGKLEARRLSRNVRALRGASSGMAMGYGGDFAVAQSGQALSSAAAPVMRSAAPAPLAAMRDAAGGEGAMDAAAGGGAMAEATVRSDFADTALWIAALETDADGGASFSLDMPENLTGWKARVWTMGPETRVGDGERRVETRKSVIVRPQAPRFLTRGDRVVLSANLHNYLPRGKTARVELVLEGGLLEAAPGVELARTIELAANGEARADWLVEARRPGEARVIMKVLTDEESDAAETIIPVIVHGMRRVESLGGVLRGEETERILRFDVPAERLPDQSLLRVSLSPAIAPAMLEALPFLIDYPHGCTEQTLNRFLPAVTVRGYLERMGVSLADARARREAAPKDEASEAWKARFGDARAAWRAAPVLDDGELAAMVARGVERLAGMQNADGGWGWFSGAGERSWPHTTAVVVHGLAAARERGAAIPMGMLERGLAWLTAYRAKELERLKARPGATESEGDATSSRSGEPPRPKARADDLDAFVHMILAERGAFDGEMRAFLYRDRLELSPTGLSMLGLALEREGGGEELTMVVRNLSQYLETNPDNATAWLRTPRTGWWRWQNDPVETQAWYLKLLARVEAHSATAAGVAKYLLENRRNGAYWRSTRDTAYAIEALTDYAVASGETDPDVTVTLYLDGRRVLERRLDRSNLFDDHGLTLGGLAVETGEHEVRLVRSGGGNLYFAASLDLFSLVDPIPAAGSDLKVTRAYYRLTPEGGTADLASASGVAVKGRVESYRREEIPGPFSDASPVPLAGGDLVEARLTIEAANDYEYLVFEDMKAAGLEAVELRSGYSGNQLGAYVEYRDQKVALFIRSLPRGRHEIAYRFRAETPGEFSALPVFGGGMYAPELFCNSDEMKVKIVEPGVFEGDL